jgi:cytochrome P450
MLPGIDPPRHVPYAQVDQSGLHRPQCCASRAAHAQVARDIVADVSEKGEFDAVPDIAAEMSLQVIADVLGVPAEDRMDVFRWSNAIGSLGIEDPDYAPTPQALGQAAAEMFSYCGELVEHRRKHGLTDDILSALLVAEVDGEKLDRDQLNEFFMLLAIAGNETTRNTLSHGIIALSEHPDQRALLAREPAAIPLAVEELLRWSSPVMHFRRTVTRDVEIGGQQIPEGDWVLIHYLSANRDEDVFERADEFDVTSGDGSCGVRRWRHALLPGRPAGPPRTARAARGVVRRRSRATVTAEPTACGRRSSTASNGCPAPRARRWGADEPRRLCVIGASQRTVRDGDAQSRSSAGPSVPVRRPCSQGGTRSATD